MAIEISPAHPRHDRFGGTPNGHDIDSKSAESEIGALMAENAAPQSRAEQFTPRPCGMGDRDREMPRAGGVIAVPVRIRRLSGQQEDRCPATKPDDRNLPHAETFLFSTRDASQDPCQASALNTSGRGTYDVALRVSDRPRADVSTMPV